MCTPFSSNAITIAMTWAARFVGPIHAPSSYYKLTAILEIDTIRSRSMSLEERDNNNTNNENYERCVPS